MAEIYRSKLGSEIVVFDRRKRTMSIFGRVNVIKLDKEDIDAQIENIKEQGHTILK
jgi:uncharacterized glyoxalase superfamily protein PhnB